jgi:membrane peptidoglycan carboxypeptidase
VAALEAGYLPNDSILGTSPCVIPNPGSVDDPWEPKNVEGDGGGVMTLTDATVSSVNCAYARLIKLVGPQKVVDVAQRMGVTNPLEANLSLTLGTSDVNPLSMASAYATLATDGERHAPYFIERVEDHDGRVLLKTEPKVERAISAQHARTTTQILTQVVNGGTGTAARLPGGWQAAGKTGSTDNNTDAWFVGFTPELSTAVWMGSPVGQVEMANVGGIRVYGGTYPAMVWGAYNRMLTAGRPPARFPAPDALTTRPPRMLTLPGEVIPDITERRAIDVPVSDGFSPRTTVVDGLIGGASPTLPPRGGGVTLPSIPATDPVSDGRRVFNDNNNDEDTPRTTRTSRVRPRDTTIPEEE